MNTKISLSPSSFLKPSTPLTNSYFISSFFRQKSGTPLRIGPDSLFPEKFLRCRVFIITSRKAFKMRRSTLRENGGLILGALSGEEVKSFSPLNNCNFHRDISAFYFSEKRNCLYDPFDRFDKLTMVSLSNHKTQDHPEHSRGVIYHKTFPRDFRL
jgi:hypothetical protein